LVLVLMEQERHLWGMQLLWRLRLLLLKVLQGVGRGREVTALWFHLLLLRRLRIMVILLVVVGSLTLSSPRAGRQGIAALKQYPFHSSRMMQKRKELLLKLLLTAHKLLALVLRVLLLLPP
jgi:hypothetical protein